MKNICLILIYSWFYSWYGFPIVDEIWLAIVCWALLSFQPTHKNSAPISYPWLVVLHQTTRANAIAGDGISSESISIAKVVFGTISYLEWKQIPPPLIFTVKLFKDSLDICRVEIDRLRDKNEELKKENAEQQVLLDEDNEYVNKDCKLNEEIASLKDMNAELKKMRR